MSGPSLRRLSGAALGGAALWVLAACGGGGESREDDLVRRGRAQYAVTCATCHHSDPFRDGTLAPAVGGSSRELLELRILHGTYPPGYQPKRETRVMPKLPLSAEDLDALHAFLNSP